MDYECFNQQAEVLVNGVSAGLWLTAGANTLVRSDPPREGQAAMPQAVTAGQRKLLQDEFFLPPATNSYPGNDGGGGGGAMRLTFVNRPHAVTELWPGRGPLKRHSMWCESDLELYCLL